MQRYNSLRSVRTATTEGEYSPVRPVQAQLVSCLLYGTLFLTVKCTSGGLHLKGFRRDVFESKLPGVRKTNLLNVNRLKLD